MRFNTEAYAKLYPRQAEVPETKESAIETFEIKGAEVEDTIETEGESEEENGPDNNS